MCHGSDSLKCTDNETCWCFTGAAAFMVYFSSELLIFFLSRLPLIVYGGVRPLAVLPVSYVT